MDNVFTSENRGKALDYFSAPKNYFWKWADNGQVIEWIGGPTICYREDLQNILRDLSEDGIPPLGSLLLVLAASNNDWWNHPPEAKNLREIINAAAQSSRLIPVSKKTLDDMLDPVSDFLKVISGLPAEYKTGEKRIRLLQTVFSKYDHVNLPPRISKNIVSEFISGNLDEAIAEDNFVLSGEKIQSDLNPLVLAGKNFPTSYLLELKIRTGVSTIPEPAETELPNEQSPNLLELLAEDSKTVGITRLTQRLIAALNIPMHSRGISDQSFGGVSDISNRGNFDRLLLSELAHDDISLMARLANNEALYLRREELPANLDLKRNILVDTTLKMWGTPRLFAISTALACAQKKKQNTEINAFALSGNSYNAIDLESKNGVVRALEQLDATLHCGNGLKNFIDEQPAESPTEYFLITAEESDHSPEFMATVSELKKSLNYLITVNRNGDLQFFEFVKGSRKLISSTKFDLEELLFSTQPTARRTKSLKDIPAILNLDEFPFFFPTSKVRMSARNVFSVKPLGVIAVTLDQRILHWPITNRGAREASPVIERGEYCFGTDENFSFFILVKNPESNLLKLYQYDRDNLEMQIVDFSKEISKPISMSFNQKFFWVTSSNEQITIDPLNKAVLKNHNFVPNNSEKSRLVPEPTLNFNNIKRHINNGYSVLNTVNKVFVNGNGNLSVDQRQITLSENKNLSIVTRPAGNLKNIHAKHIETVSLDSLSNSYIKFSKFAWGDGSEAWVDSRGLLHLRSSDKNIPEITIVLIVGKDSAGWTSDGKFFGSPYFIGESKSISAQDFFINYLQPFIDTLRQ